ncbi:MAG: PDZ domain-containing protein [Gemmatimonadaceae bacterium]|nr:PDZ domain-containing protein [Acetobacteraceae bacterium]
MSVHPLALRKHVLGSPVPNRVGKAARATRVMTDGGRPPPLHVVIESARVAAATSYLSPDTEVREPLTALVRMAAQAMDAPVAMLSLIGRHHQQVLAAIGTEARSIPRALALCNHTIGDPSRSVVVPDAAQDAQFRRHPLVAFEPHIRFYAGICLVDTDGYAVGTMCVMDVRVATATADAVAQLRQVAGDAMAVLTSDRAERYGSSAAVGERAPIEAPCWLGVRTQHGPVPRMNRDGRLLVSVASNSPADRGGLRTGDIILEIDGQAARRRNDLSAALARCKPGDIMRLTIWRDGATVHCAVPLDRHPDSMGSQRRTG